MHNSGASRRGIANACLDDIARSEATKQSTLLFCGANHGLLRGACHRARIRATRWLAMTFSVLAVLKFESEPSSSAKADDPVFRNASDEIEKPRRTGYPACARLFVEQRCRATPLRRMWLPPSPPLPAPSPPCPRR